MVLNSLFGLGNEGSGGTLDADIALQESFNKFIDPQTDQARRTLNQYSNPFAARFGESFQNVGASQVTAEQIGARNLGGALRASARASTQESQFAAIQAARQANSRGGLAFGGGSANVAAAAARDAEIERGRLFADAEAQGVRYRTSVDQFNAQQRAQTQDTNARLRQQADFQRAGALEDALRAQSQAYEQQFDRRANFEQSLLALIAQGNFQLRTQGLAGNSGRQNRKAAVGEQLTGTLSLGTSGGGGEGGGGGLLGLF